MSNHETRRGSDAGAAFTGLIVGALVLGIVLYGIVRLTSARYAHEQPAAAATTSH